MIYHVSLCRGSGFVYRYRYDLHYIKYMTGITPLYIPSWCGGSKSESISGHSIKYLPYRSEILLGPSRDNLDHNYYCDSWTWKCNAWDHPILKSLTLARETYNIMNNNNNNHNNHNNTHKGGGKAPIFARIKDLYSNGYTLKDFASHRAIVLLPYQSSVMTAQEMYRLNIPLFVPSKTLLLTWHISYNILFERIYGHPSPLPVPIKTTTTDNDNDGTHHPNHGIPDPNSNDPSDVAYWFVTIILIYSLCCCCPISFLSLSLSLSLSLALLVILLLLLLIIDIDIDLSIS
jgi:hypothetical protein